MNWENIKRMLSEGLMESAEYNEELLNKIAQKKAEIAETEQLMITLQDLMREAQIHLELLIQECDTLEAQTSSKKSVVDAINSVLKSKTVNTAVETGSTNVEMFSHQISSTLNKLRYEYRKGAITKEEFEQKIQEIKESIDEEFSQI